MRVILRYNILTLTQAALQKDKHCQLIEREHLKEKGLVVSLFYVQDDSG